MSSENSQDVGSGQGRRRKETAFERRGGAGRWAFAKGYAAANEKVRAQEGYFTAPIRRFVERHTVCHQQTTSLAPYSVFGSAMGESESGGHKQSKTLQTGRTTEPRSTSYCMDAELDAVAVLLQADLEGHERRGSVLLPTIHQFYPGQYVSNFVETPRSMVSATKFQLRHSTFIRGAFQDRLLRDAVFARAEAEERTAWQDLQGVAPVCRRLVNRSESVATSGREKERGVVGGRRVQRLDRRLVMDYSVLCVSARFASCTWLIRKLLIASPSCRWQGRRRRT